MASERTTAGRPYSLFCILLATLLFGCTTPQDNATTLASCGPSRTFHIVSHGWHAGVVIASRDLAERVPELTAGLGAARLVELGWGDAAYYQTPEPTMSLALRAVLYPTDAVLHVVTISAADPRSEFPGSTVVTLTVPASGYERLLDHLVETFERTPDGAPIALGAGLYGDSRFYRARGRFHAFNTCNTWVARGVATTGYPLRSPTVVTTEGLLTELRRAPNTPCFSRTLTEGPRRNLEASKRSVVMLATNACSVRASGASSPSKHCSCTALQCITTC